MFEFEHRHIRRIRGEMGKENATVESLINALVQPVLFEF